MAPVAKREGVFQDLSIPQNMSGSHKTAYPRVAYPIQTTINPQNINAILASNAACFDLPIPVINTNIKKPAKRGCKSTRRDHASINGNTKKSKLNGEKTAL